MSYPKARTKSPAKPDSSRSLQLQLFERVRALEECCSALVMEVDPQNRSAILSRLAIVQHGNDNADNEEPADGS